MLSSRRQSKETRIESLWTVRSFREKSVRSHSGCRLRRRTLRLNSRWSASSARNLRPNFRSKLRMLKGKKLSWTQKHKTWSSSMKTHWKAKKPKFWDSANKTSTWPRLLLQTNSLWASSWTSRGRSALKWTANCRKPSITTTRIRRCGRVNLSSWSNRETSRRKTTKRPPKSLSQR